VENSIKLQSIALMKMSLVSMPHFYKIVLICVLLIISIPLHLLNCDTTYTPQKNT